MNLLKINGVIKNYDWGTRDYLPSLFGINDGKRQAEYWMGTHSKGEAMLNNGETLSCFLGYKLPFLFKVLSIDSPLSLQCHPTKAQAIDGWKREEKIREEGGEYNYQDDNEKAEILSALTPVTALCGFRDENAISSNLEKYIPEGRKKYLKGKEDIKGLFLSLFGLSKEEKEDVLDELKSSITKFNNPKKEGEYLTQDGIISETLAKYPSDIGSVFPLMMNVIHLKPFEAIYLEPDTLHAYVSGNGVELMTASDNVLRGGLTPKRIDIKELERIMKFGSSLGEKVKCTEKDGVFYYITPSPDFSLSYIANGKGKIEKTGDTILLCLEGTINLEWVNESKTIKRGECYYINNNDVINIFADGICYIASKER